MDFVTRRRDPPFRRQAAPPLARSRAERLGPTPSTPLPSPVAGADTSQSFYRDDRANLLVLLLRSISPQKLSAIYAWLRAGVNPLSLPS